MKREEAIVAMRNGEKVTHRHFTDDEWMTIGSVGLYTLKME